MQHANKPTHSKSRAQILIEFLLLCIIETALPISPMEFFAGMTKAANKVKTSSPWKDNEQEVVGNIFGVSTIWVFPKIVGFQPKSSILIGFSIINHPF